MNTRFATRRISLLLLVAVAFGALSALSAVAQAEDKVAKVSHPFLMWTAEEAKALKQRIKSDPAVKKQWERTVKIGRSSKASKVFVDLLEYMVMGNEEFANDQRKKLIRFIGHKPDPMTWNVDLDKLKWNEGMPSSGDRHMRDEQTEQVIRYDVLYDRLTEKERKGVEKAFMSYIDFHLAGHKPWHPAFAYDRTSWLPNMHYPRTIGTHIMAVGLKDPELIKKMFEGTGGLKFWFDEYLADDGFYMEEFGKFYSNIGSFLIWCEGLEELGLNKYGYGYTGKNGATMQKFLTRNTIDITYPRVEWGGNSMPTYPRVTMGDAKGNTFGGDAPILHTTITGQLPNGKGGERWWSNAHMNGPMSKMQMPFWLEAMHAQWPDEGYDYFLAQLREPGETIYHPTLLWGVGPVDASKVIPPKPYPSFVAKQRGFAFLKADHTPGYWEGWKPAVSLQFARYYVHYVHDCFSLLGYYAHNAPIYVNAGGSGRGYAGGNAWKDSVRGHSGVIVDNLQAQPVARLADGTKGHSYRQNLQNDLNVRFAAVRAAGVYPDVDMERALLLTDDYLFDAFWLNSSQGERTYDWQVQSPATARTTDGWAATNELDGGKLYVGSKFEKKTANGKQDLGSVRKLSAGKDVWALQMVHQPSTEKAADDPLGAEFYARGVGVKVHMLPDPDADTTVYVGKPPSKKPQNTRGSASTLIARRKAKNTTFVALHDHFDKETPNVKTFEAIARNDKGVFVKVTGTGKQQPIDDRIAVRLGDDADKPLTLSGNGESITFRNVVFIRIGKKTVRVVGELDALTLNVAKGKTLMVNGKQVNVKWSDGKMTYKRDG